jgi:uncharacterized membrane protein
MTKNMGTIDRVLRSLLAVVIGILIVMGKITGVLAIVLGVFSVVFLVTSFVAWCPAYVPFRISTRK